MNGGILTKHAYTRWPGLYVDLLYLYTLHYEPALFESLAKLFGMEGERNRLQVIQDALPPYPDELRPFFERTGSRAVGYFGALLFSRAVAEQLADGDPLAMLTERFRDAAAVRAAVCGELFPGAGAADERAYARLIYDAPFPDAFKASLLHLLLDTDAVLAVFRDDLAARSARLRAVCEGWSDETADFAPPTASEYETLRMASNAERPASCCSLLRVMRYLAIQIGDCAAVGTRFREGLAVSRSADGTLALPMLGKVLSDENRIAMLEALMRAGELTRSELGKPLDLSITAVQYHLSILTLSGAVLVEESGKTFRYRLNPAYFPQAVERLARWAGLRQ